MSISHYILLCSSLAASAWTFPSWDYLPAIGPSPIRFQKPNNTQQTIAMFPPLPPIPPSREFEVKVENFNPPSEVVSSSIGQQNIVIVPPLSETDNSNLTNAFVVTPQMLVEFFHRREHGADGHDTSVITPLRFVPPTNLQKPSSTAVYESY